MCPVSLTCTLQEFETLDRAEVQLSGTYSLPLDPFLGKQATDEIDLPLTAFSYLLRRLTVSNPCASRGSEVLMPSVTEVVYPVLSCLP